MKNNFFSEHLLQNKQVLVAGASKGIGRACAIALAAAGANVLAIARSEKQLQQLAKQAQNLAGSIDYKVLDATSNAFFEHINNLKIDILVNNLGINRPKPLIEVTDEDLDEVININISLMFKITRTVVQTMLANSITGSIINISSQMGHIGSPNRTLYCATKHAVEGLTKSLAVELGPENIRVNSVAPTFIETELTANMLADPNFKKFVIDNIPLKKLGEVEDVANATVYLASDLSKMITGSSIKVDGGWTAH